MRAYKKSNSLMLVPVIMILFFASVSSIAYACEEDIKLVITSPIDKVPPIDKTPKMPTINIQAELIGAQAKPHIFQWKATLSYTWLDKINGMPVSPKQTFNFEGKTYGDLETTWTPDFQEQMGQDVMGGDLVVVVSTVLDDGSVYTDTKTFRIRGEVIEPDDIKRELGGAEGVEYQVLAYKESSTMKT